VGYEALREVNPRLVVTSITPFGQTGPYSGYEGDELLCYAMSTIMSISGTRDREPLKHGGFQAQYEGGLNGAGATTMALFHQSMTGEGQHLDVCITECVASTMLATQSMYAYTGGVQARRPAEGTLFGNPMACADGWVIGQTGGGATWDTQVDFYGMEELRDKRFSEAGQRINNGAEMDALMEEGIKDRGRWELFHEASRNRMLFGLVQTPEDMASCLQLESRGFYREVEHPVMGHVRLPAVLLNMSATPYQLRLPAPLLGQHNLEVYGRLGYTSKDLTRLRRMDVV
jgi:crotonobetainyl-CoA:carnitine CoA-transferase CaiB-like acyl-CoA transferase